MPSRTLYRHSDRLLRLPHSRLPPIEFLSVWPVYKYYHPTYSCSKGEFLVKKLKDCSLQISRKKSSCWEIVQFVNLSWGQCLQVAFLGKRDEVAVFGVAWTKPAFARQRHWKHSQSSFLFVNGLTRTTLPSICDKNLVRLRSNSAALTQWKLTAHNKEALL